MLTVVKVDGVRGFVPNSWIVLNDKGAWVASFLSKSEAYEFVENNKQN